MLTRLHDLAPSLLAYSALATLARDSTTGQACSSLSTFALAPPFASISLPPDNRRALSLTWFKFCSNVFSERPSQTPVVKIEHLSLSGSSYSPFSPSCYSIALSSHILYYLFICLVYCFSSHSGMQISQR